MSITETQPQANIVPFLTLMNPNVKLHAIVEMITQQTEFGEITFTVNIKNGEADVKSLNTVVRKRYKY
jgi:hypothetical protein